jgi:hypothetical protein
MYVDLEIDWPVVPNWRFGKVSHLYGSPEWKLHQFAAELGLKREWCSDHTQPHSMLLHYDLSPGKRKQALAMGAIYDRTHKKMKGIRRMRSTKLKQVLKKNGWDINELTKADLHPYTGKVGRKLRCKQPDLK